MSAIARSSPRGCVLWSLSLRTLRHGRILADSLTGLKRVPVLRSSQPQATPRLCPFWVAAGAPCRPSLATSHRSCPASWWASLRSPRPSVPTLSSLPSLGRSCLGWILNRISVRIKLEGHSAVSGAGEFLITVARCNFALRSWTEQGLLSSLFCQHYYLSLTAQPQRLEAVLLLWHLTQPVLPVHDNLAVLFLLGHFSWFCGSHLLRSHFPGC